MVVRPSSSVKSIVLRASGQSPPHSSVITSRSGGTTSLTTPVISISSPSPLRQPKRYGAPGRSSSSQTGIVQPGGPSIHCVMCSGSV